MTDPERIRPADRAAWRAWLSEHAETSAGVWLVYTKGAGRTLPYDAIVEEALCFGWVDSLPRSLDDASAMLYVAPRKARSSWSRVNKERIERLTAAGLMAPPGIRAVETAKANGSWAALDEVETLEEPPDLRRALDAVPPARTAWDGFPRSAKRAILEWIGAAKRDETRAQRVRTTVEEAAAGRRADQWRQPKSAPPA
jgi:uncharacterized protein YdeI (YjbR/CyaY-like superfamily)